MLHEIFKKCSLMASESNSSYLEVRTPPIIFLPDNNRTHKVSAEVSANILQDLSV